MEATDLDKVELWKSMLPDSELAEAITNYSLLISN